MKSGRHFFFSWGGTVAMLVLASSFALAQGNGKGNGKGHGKNKHGDDDNPPAYAFSDHDRDVMRAWYDDHRGSLPPGLAKKDRLPPGLEKQLAERGTLPPGLQKRIQPLPVELERELPAPPPDCAHVVIGGHVVLLNRRTNLVLAVFHFEIG
jgi:hypothetical protein